jgi:hypothetical protein
MSMYTEEGIATELFDAVLCPSDISVSHMPDHAGFYVQIGKFTMSLPYAQAEKPDPAFAKGWTQRVNENGETWRKGDLCVARPRQDFLQAGTLQWVFGRSYTDGEAWVISGRCVSRDVAMAAAEALP